MTKKPTFILNFILIVFSLLIFSKNFYHEIFSRYLIDPNFFSVFFNDFSLIYKASLFLIDNKNPYNEWLNQTQTPFFNPPIVFESLKFIANIDYYYVIRVWTALSIAFFCSIPLIFKKIFNTNNLSIIIFIASFGGISISVYFSGNISIFLNFLFAISLYFLSKNKENYYFFLISFLSIIKFPYLIFFGLPILLKKINLKLCIKIFLFIFLITLFYLFYFYLNNDLFLSWYNSLKLAKTIGDDGDFGRGIYRIISNTLVNNNPSVIFYYLIYSLFIFSLSYFIFQKSKILKNKNIRLALGVIVLVICLPRLKSYDLLILIPSIYFIIESLKFKKYDILIKFILLLMLICWTSPYAPLFLTLILISIFLFDLKINFLEGKKKL